MIPSRRSCRSRTKGGHESFVTNAISSSRDGQVTLAENRPSLANRPTHGTSNTKTTTSDTVCDSEAPDAAARLAAEWISRSPESTASGSVTSNTSTVNKSGNGTQSRGRAKGGGVAKNACAFCAYSKKRCDGEIPACRACRKRDIDCVYPTRRSRFGRQKHIYPCHLPRGPLDPSQLSTALRGGVPLADCVENNRALWEAGGGRRRGAHAGRMGRVRGANGTGSTGSKWRSQSLSSVTSADVGLLENQFMSTCLSTFGPFLPVSNEASIRRALVFVLANKDWQCRASTNIDANEPNATGPTAAKKTPAAAPRPSTAETSQDTSSASTPSKRPREDTVDEKSTDTQTSSGSTTGLATAGPKKPSFLNPGNDTQCRELFLTGQSAKRTLMGTEARPGKEEGNMASAMALMWCTIALGAKLRGVERPEYLRNAYESIRHSGDGACPDQVRTQLLMATFRSMNKDIDGYEAHVKEAATMFARMPPVSETEAEALKGVLSTYKHFLENPMAEPHRFSKLLENFEMPGVDRSIEGGDLMRNVDVGRMFLFLECLYTKAWLRHVRLEREERAGALFPRGEGPLYEIFVRKPGLGAVIDRTLDVVRWSSSPDSAASLLMTLSWKAFYLVFQGQPSDGLKVAQTAGDAIAGSTALLQWEPFWHYSHVLAFVLGTGGDRQRYAKLATAHNLHTQEEKHMLPEQMSDLRPEKCCSLIICQDLCRRMQQEFYIQAYLERNPPESPTASTKSSSGSPAGAACGGGGLAHAGVSVSATGGEAESNSEHAANVAPKSTVSVAGSAAPSCQDETVALPPGGRQAYRGGGRVPRQVHAVADTSYPTSHMDARIRDVTSNGHTHDKAYERAIIPSGGHEAPRPVQTDAFINGVRWPTELTAGATAYSDDLDPFETHRTSDAIGAVDACPAPGRASAKDSVQAGTAEEEVDIDLLEFMLENIEQDPLLAQQLQEQQGERVHRERHHQQHHRHPQQQVDFIQNWHKSPRVPLSSPEEIRQVRRPSSTIGSHEMSQKAKWMSSGSGHTGSNDLTAMQQQGAYYGAHNGALTREHGHPVHNGNSRGNGGRSEGMPRSRSDAAGVSSWAHMSSVQHQEAISSRDHGVRGATNHTLGDVGGLALPSISMEPGILGGRNTGDTHASNFDAILRRPRSQQWAESHHEA